ncbi:hypothetical protein EI42_03438 [Thermosporothrix hazakensis]|jgi:hypothetical protein|uniref:Uncharacterized protein n=1 Tax=Thermosporothrix hazakensis TaxID=644383 RepID=A0A326U674_THEHA|nr:hypothetical protein EI42_03438 [Thermosporothrix hazakensis]
MCRGKKESSLEKGLLSLLLHRDILKKKDVASNLNGTFSLCKLFML